LRDERRSGPSRRVVRHKDQKNLRAHTNTDSSAKTSETLGQKIHAQSVANGLAETKEGFADSISESDAQNEIKTQKSVS
jgi:RNA:NAD 2'-phosphotransferase (TPT1/KptA family)